MSPHGSPTKGNELYPNSDPLSPIATNGRDVASRMNTIAPGPFGININHNSGGNRIHKVMPPASTGANVEPPLANYPYEGNERRQRRDQAERSSKEYVATHRQGGDRVGERARDQEVPRRAPTSDSDYSGRRTSQSPESQSRQPLEGRSVPAALPPSMFGQRGGKIQTEGPKFPYSHQSRHSGATPSNPKIEGLRPEARSKTFPAVNNERPNGRLPPHPGVGLPRSPSQTVRNRKNKFSTNLSNVLLAPAPADVLDVVAMDARTSEPRRQPSMEDMLKVFPLPSRGISSLVGTRPPPTISPPNPNEYSDFSIGNPYEAETRVEDPHIASPSISSNASSIFSHRSERSSASAMSSPPTPDVSGSKFDLGGRRPSNAPKKTNSGVYSSDHIDGLMREIQSSIYDLVSAPGQDRPKGDPLTIPHNHARGPPYGHPEPVPLQRQPPPPGVYQQPPSPRVVPPTPGLRPLQYAERLPVPRRKQSVPLGSPVEELFLPLPPPPPPPSPPPQLRGRERPAHRSTTKGNCRGCRGGIVGKSISSADGRLTGRYHKACFVCQDCHKPFESAEFYVHNNLPYCERHYHKLNQSLCPTCDRGIEGPCLETEWHERYHPSCFSCSVSISPPPPLPLLFRLFLICSQECACSLDGDYFEFNRRPYCEQHAYQMRGKQLAPNRMANMERRKTRMMFM